MFGAVQHTPRKVLLEKQIPMLEAELATLKSPSHGQWDDAALAHLLYGVCKRYVAYPHPQAVETPEEAKDVDARANLKDTAEQALASLKWVVENGPKIELDHQLVYCARTRRFRPSMLNDCLSTA